MSTMSELPKSFEPAAIEARWAPRWEDRPRSRYEAKGIAAGRTIYDLCYGIREGGRR